jgi:hypothetical protein
MPNTREDKAVHEMEADIAGMAQRLRPSVNAHGATPMPQVRDKVTVSHLAKALDQLTGELRQAGDAAWTQATKLTGVKDEGGASDVVGNAKDAPIFEGLAQQVMDSVAQLARIKRAQAAIERALS